MLWMFGFGKATMIVVVLENPEPDSPIRKDVNIEIRMMIKGATDEEGERIGEAIRKATKMIRPNQKLKAFQLDAEETEELDRRIRC